MFIPLKMQTSRKVIFMNVKIITVIIAILEIDAIILALLL